MNSLTDFQSAGGPTTPAKFAKNQQGRSPGGGQGNKFGGKKSFGGQQSPGGKPQNQGKGNLSPPFPDGIS